MLKIVIGILLVAILVYTLTRKTNRKKLPHATYICDVCGEKDCICHKTTGHL